MIFNIIPQKVYDLHKKYHIYGVSFNQSSTSPVMTAYLDDAVGMIPGDASWDNTSLYAGIKPCLLKNGIVQTYLNPMDFTKRANNTSVDTVTSDSDVMIEFPFFGYKIETVGNYINVHVTQNALSGYNYNHMCSPDDGKMRDKFYVAAYRSSLVEGRLRSLKGKSTDTTFSLSTARSNFASSNSRYGNLNFNILKALQCLYLVRFGDRNTSVKFGVGGRESTGATDILGMYAKSANNTPKILGIEGLWGGYSTWCDGLMIRGTSLFTKDFGFNDILEGYTESYSFAIAGGLANIKEVIGNNTMGFYGKSIITDGTFGTYWCDAINANLNGTIYCLLIGGHDFNAFDGLFKTVMIYTPTRTYSAFTTRMIYV